MAGSPANFMVERHRVGRSTVTFLRERFGQPRPLAPLPGGHALVELQKLNVGNSQAVVRFVDRYGLPDFGPVRFLNEMRRAAAADPAAAASIAEWLEGFSADALLCHGFSFYEGALGRTGGNVRHYVERFFTSGEALRRENAGAGMSLVEAKMCLRQIQNAVAVVAAMDRFSDPNEAASYCLRSRAPQFAPHDFEGPCVTFLSSRALGDVSPVNTATEGEARDLQLRLQALAMQEAHSEAVRFLRLVANPEEDTPLVAEIPDAPGLRGLQLAGGYAASVANQLFDTIALDSNWRQCPAPGCGRIYKLHQEFNPAKSKRRKISAYCSRSCRTIAKSESSPG